MSGLAGRVKSSLCGHPCSRYWMWNSRHGTASLMSAAKAVTPAAHRPPPTPFFPCRYKVGSSTELVAYVYFYHWATKLVISDIDGTITRYGMGSWVCFCRGRVRGGREAGEALG